MSHEDINKSKTARAQMSITKETKNEFDELDFFWVKLSNDAKIKFLINFYKESKK